MSEMARAYARCLHLERERERKHRKYTACAASDARAFHYEAPQTHGEDDEELDYGWDVTDEGDGAGAVRSFEERRDGSYYTRRIKIARVRLSRKHPELLEVFSLVLKNGKNRRESIAELAARGLSPDAARTLYWKHLKKSHFSSRSNKDRGADDVPHPLVSPSERYRSRKTFRPYGVGGVRFGRGSRARAPPRFQRTGDSEQ